MQEAWQLTIPQVRGAGGSSALARLMEEVGLDTEVACLEEVVQQLEGVTWEQKREGDRVVEKLLVERVDLLGMEEEVAQLEAQLEHKLLSGGWHPEWKKGLHQKP